MTDLELFLRDTDEEYRGVTAYCYEKYGSSIGWGWTRNTFRGKWGVVKVPKNTAGEVANFNEAHNFKSGTRDTVYAKCRLRLFKGVPIIVMEWIDTEWWLGLDGGTSDIWEAPWWVTTLDMCQAGHDKFGEWKAFDYGDYRDDD